MPRKRKYPNSSNVPISEDSGPKSILAPKDAVKSLSGKSTVRLSSPSKSSPTKGRAALTKPADAASPAERSACPCDARSPPSDAPAEGSALSITIGGRWSASNARIFTFGDGSYSLKTGGRCIGEGISLHVLDLKPPGSSERTRPADVDVDVAGRTAVGGADAVGAAARSPSEDRAGAPPPPAAAGRGRAVRVARRSRVEIVVLPEPDSIEDDDPGLPVGPLFPSPEGGLCGQGRPIGAPRCRSRSGDGVDSAGPSSPRKRRRLDELSPDDEAPAGGRPARAPRRRGDSAATSALPSPAMTPLPATRLLRHADRSATPGDGGAGGCGHLRRAFLPGTPRDFDLLLRTPTRPDTEGFPCGGGDSGGADGDRLPSPLLSFGSPSGPDRGRARRPTRHAAEPCDADAGAAGAAGARLSAASLVWEDRLACHETLDHLAFDADESEIYEWQRSLNTT
jgi:hypothetical protein